jgi:hypothetical protein
MIAHNHDNAHNVEFDYGGGYEAYINRTSMTLLVSKILMDLTDLIVKPSVDFLLCISKAS